MNKLLLVAILGFVVLSLTAAAEEESKSEIAVEAGTEVDALANVEIDENLADPESRRRRRKKKGKKNGKKVKRNRRKKNKNKKKARRNKNKKKANKKRNKQKNGKGRRVRKMKAARQETCGCAVNLWKYRDVMVKYGNYEKQFKRITKFKGLGEKKLAKKGGFAKGATYLKESGGGDSDNLTCNGASTNNAAKQIKNLTTFIENCTDHINDVCNTSMPKPPPDNETKPCLDAIASFKAIMTNCTKDKNDGAKLCTCVGNKALPNLTETINSCDLSKKYLKNFVAYKGNCIKAFGDCRKYEDEVGGAVATCGKDPKKELDKLVSTMKNQERAEKVKPKIDAELAKAGRSARAVNARAAVTCAVFAVNVSDFTKKFAARPDRPDIITLGDAIINATVATCTDADKASLVKTQTVIAATIAKVKEFIAVQQEALSQLTGTTASTAVIAAASSSAAAAEAAAATTAASAGRKRAAHANLLRRLREVKS